MTSYYYQPTTQTYQEYVLSGTNDRDRLMIQHDIYKPAVVNVFQQILLEYGLLHKLQQAKALKMAGMVNYPKVRILDFGCGEGLYLYDLADLLEAHDLIDVVELIGVDMDSTAISTAIEFCKISEPPRPYIKFVNRDLLLPFQGEAVTANTNTTTTTYDFIFAILVVEHLAEAQHQVQRIYQHLLKPDGVIFLRDTIVQLAPFGTKAEDQAKIEGWTLPHPAMYPIYQQMTGFLRGKNPGIEIATASAQWFKELGATEVTAQRSYVVSGGSTAEGMGMLRNLVMGIRNGAPFLISRGLLSQAQYDETMRELFADLNAYSQGYIIPIDTVAHKPAN
jgi:2-polyprenyl-3-methyl-5-hydroxy-6-metoxy-1,4-benzoquinol methylase